MPSVLKVRMSLQATTTEAQQSGSNGPSGLRHPPDVLTASHSNGLVRECLSVSVSVSFSDGHHGSRGSSRRLALNTWTAMDAGERPGAALTGPPTDLKACWWQPLSSSSLVPSASPTRAAEGPDRPAVGTSSFRGCTFGYSSRHSGTTSATRPPTGQMPDQLRTEGTRSRSAGIDQFRLRLSDHLSTVLQPTPGEGAACPSTTISTHASWRSSRRN